MRDIDTDSLNTLLTYAKGRNLRVGSHEHVDADGNYWVPTTGHSGPNDPHYFGNAIDVGMRGRDVPAEIASAKAAGFKVLDENYTGNGPYGYSSGPHLHLEYYGGSTPTNGSSTPPNSSLASLTPLQQQVVDTANKYGIPPAKFLALIQRESSFDPNALGKMTKSGQAIGLGQLMQGTAQALGVDPHDPSQNLDGAARYLKQQYDKFGDWDTATAAYIGGPGKIAAGQPFVGIQNKYEQQWISKLGSTPTDSTTQQPNTSVVSANPLEKYLTAPALGSSFSGSSDTTSSQQSNPLEKYITAPTLGGTTPLVDISRQASSQSTSSLVSTTQDVPSTNPLEKYILQPQVPING